MKNLLALLFFSFILLSCNKHDNAAAIAKAETDFKAAPTKENYAALINLYKTYLKDNPTDKALAFKYSTAAASMEYKNKEMQSALHLAGDAISKYGAGQNLSEPTALLALISRDVKYKELATLRFEKNDFDRLGSLLQNNYDWLDSALISMKKQLMVDSTQRIDKEMCLKYSFVAEAAASVRLDQKRSPELLMAAAEGALAAENFNKAVSLFDQIAVQFPNAPKAPQALFLKAFTLENNLADLPKAKEAYELFLKTYPNDGFADDAKMALKNLGKSPEELIKEFEKKKK